MYSCSIIVLWVHTNVSPVRVYVEYIPGNYAVSTSKLCINLETDICQGGWISLPQSTGYHTLCTYTNQTVTCTFHLRWRIKGRPLMMSVFTHCFMHATVSHTQWVQQCKKNKVAYHIQSLLPSVAVLPWSTPTFDFCKWDYWKTAPQTAPYAETL